MANVKLKLQDSDVEFELKDGVNLIGRVDTVEESYPEVDLENHDPDAKISRKHAQIEVTPEGVFLKDLGSLNGTFINRNKRLEEGERLQVEVGDEIIVGKTVLNLESVE